MKKRLFLGLLSIYFLLTSLSAQDVFPTIAQAFRKGSSQELGKYMASKVELVIPHCSIGMDKAEAQKAMTAFFSAYKTNNFSVIHQGQRDESAFIIGMLTTVNGEFRVNCILKKIQDRYFINQIRIERNNE